MAGRIASRKTTPRGAFADTAQNRRAIERLVRNVFPRFDVKFFQAPEATTLAIQIIHEVGTVKSRVIRIHFHQRDVA